jgi:AcrR family transcriptional regulator
MGIAERKNRERKNMRRVILDTAMKLFLEEGFEKVTMRRIAEIIEYSPASIYSYFENKDDILYALYREGFEELYRRQQSVLTIEDPVKRLRKHGEVCISFAFESPELYDLMFIMRGPVKKIQERDEGNAGLVVYEFLKQNVKECMDAGLIPKTNVDAATFSFWSLVHGMVSLIIRERCIMFSEEQLKNITMDSLDFILMRVLKKGE